ncbi:unnamed protein product, partial [Ectocarpus fasciculatus]
FSSLHQRQDVLKSPELTGVRAVLRAWRSNEYVTFFRLIPQQGMMQRCLLLPYVKKMRDSAIEV